MAIDNSFEEWMASQGFRLTEDAAWIGPEGKLSSSEVAKLKEQHNKNTAGTDINKILELGLNPNDAGYVALNPDLYSWFNENLGTNFGSTEDYLNWVYGGGNVVADQSGTQWFQTPNGPANTVNTPLDYNPQGFEIGDLALMLIKAGIGAEFIPMLTGMGTPLSQMNLSNLTNLFNSGADPSSVANQIGSGGVDFTKSITNPWGPDVLDVTNATGTFGGIDTGPWGWEQLLNTGGGGAFVTDPGTTPGGGNLFNTGTGLTAQQLAQLPGGASSLLKLAALALGTGAAAGAGKSLLNPTSTTTQTTTRPPMSPEELQLLKLNTELAQKQAKNVGSLTQMQQQLLADTLAAIKAADPTGATPGGAQNAELNKMLMDTLRGGGAATPDQLARIRAATNAAIASGFGDIDLATERGVGIISDEIANARGLRLTDTPILREATLLARNAQDQKTNLLRSLLAKEAELGLTYPLDVANMMSGINQRQQALGLTSDQFIADLKQRAVQNRLALTGTVNQGIGLASDIMNRPLDILSRNRAGDSTTTQTATSSAGLKDIAHLMAGLGMLTRRIEKLWP